MINNSYNFIMRSLMSYSDCSLFALVDGLQYERHFGDEIQHEQGVAEPFLNSWPDARLAFAGPWLFSLNNSVSHRDKLKQLAEAVPSVSWIISSESLESLIDHFRSFLNLQLPDGWCAIFRFYDPRILAEIEFLLEETHYMQLINRTKEWVFQVDGEMMDMKSKASYYTGRWLKDRGN
ncbi:DUF4123 domain-containing protein [Enterobacter hormaechei subsp. hoffmannii]|nr:DUF4123 domain-containing protein [Enterobacter hormaechei subsp. hoffmannii]MCU3423358.1 DUF4123 domain-containing protein [Enterobacter hormaechei subsp. hoffmannii]MCU3775251.1 DUF4123 domain-containing protein [Enterobacter hormaechei subsp. hoffmannii]